MKPGYVLFREGYADEADICETLDDVREILRERRDDDGSYFDEYVLPEMRLYAVTGDTIPIGITPAVVSIGEPTKIPAPLPGETVSDYARRITGAN